MDQFFQEIAASFQKTFIKDDRWLQFLKGLGVTIEITVVAAVIGIILGFLIAMVRSTYDKNLTGKKCRKPSDYLLKFLNVLCNIYITVIRGTPVVIQLMIMYYIIFSSSRNGIIAAVLAFGINSGAYVAEIVRSGIMSIDKGQFEASRSLGFNYSSTMLHVILPQAFKNVLPALGNEFIVLVKETSGCRLCCTPGSYLCGQSYSFKNLRGIFPAYFGCGNLPCYSIDSDILPQKT